MSQHRFGALLAVLVLVGWSVALAITAVFWLPQLRGVDPLFYEDGRQFLTFVADNPLTWRLFHLATTLALLAQLPLVQLLSRERSGPLTDSLCLIGLTGTALALLASLIDQFMTPVLAAWGGTGNVPVAVFIWESVEPLRDNGFKTISFLLLGWWLIGLAGRPPVDLVTKISNLLGWGLVVLGVVEALLPLPWRNQWGETGVLGFILFLLPVWGWAVARRYWRRELDEYLVKK